MFRSVCDQINKFRNTLYNLLVDWLFDYFSSAQNSCYFLYITDIYPEPVYFDPEFLSVTLKNV